MNSYNLIPSPPSRRPTAYVLQLHTREIYFVNNLYNKITHTVRVLFWLVVYLVVGRVELEGGLGGESGGRATRRALVIVAAAATSLPFQAAEWQPQGLAAATATAPGRLSHIPNIT